VVVVSCGFSVVVGYAVVVGHVHPVGVLVVVGQVCPASVAPLGCASPITALRGVVGRLSERPAANIDRELSGGAVVLLDDSVLHQSGLDGVCVPLVLLTERLHGGPLLEGR